MPKVCELGALEKLLPHSLLSKSWIWNRQVTELTPAELLVFLRINQDRIVEARRNIDSLLHETYRCMVAGHFEQAPYAGFAEPDPVFTVTDLAEMLEPVSTERRRAAAVFALETAMPPKEVMTLDWVKARRLRDRLTGLAESLMIGSPRHLRLDYVFWEYLENGVAAPLFGLEEELQGTTGMDYTSLLALYRKMAWVDPEAEFHSFEREIH